MPLFNKPTDQKLIHLVEKYPALYDKNFSDYKSLTHRNAAWEEIAAVIKRPAEECRHRWKDIRDQYKRLLNRKYSSTPILNSKFDNVQLKFLDKFFADKEEIVYLIEDGYQTSCVTVKTPSLVSCQPIPGGNSSSTEIKDYHNSGNTNSKKLQHPAILSKRYNTNGSTGDISDPESATEEIPYKKPLKQKNLPKKSKKLKTEVEVYRNSTNGWSREITNGGSREIANGGSRAIVNGERREIVNVIKQERSVPEEEHPIHTFFRSMASTVMTFPVHLIAETRMEVCNIVSRLELRAVMENELQTCQVIVSDD